LFLLGDGWQALNSRVARCGAIGKQVATAEKSVFFELFA
jgi:hypothetical protein